MTADPRERASWEGLADVAAFMPTGWSLAGGSLVRLHIAERGGDGGRSTRDIDVILDVRAEPQAIRKIVTALEASHFERDGLNPAGQDHRWVRGDAQIDVLAPDFLGPYLQERRHPGLGRLLSTRGAQFGLHRTERVNVAVDDFELMVNRPDLVGALYEKCSALLVSLDRDKERHLGDIGSLATLVAPQDRRELLGLRRREKRRLMHGLSCSRSRPGVDDRQAFVLEGLVALLRASLEGQ